MHRYLTGVRIQTPFTAAFKLAFSSLPCVEMESVQADDLELFYGFNTGNIRVSVLHTQTVLHIPFYRVDYPEKSMKNRTRK